LVLAGAGCLMSSWPRLESRWGRFGKCTLFLDLSPNDYC
jgi:hypothetical protein